MLNKYYNQSLRYRTQKALEIINHKQDYHIQFMQSTDIAKSIGKHFGKEIQSNQWMKIQLLPRTSQIFQLICALKIDTFHPIVALKLIIKDFNGSCIHLSASSKPQMISLQKCEYRVCKEVVIKMNVINMVNNKMYLTIHSAAELTIFKMKYYFVADNMRIQLKNELQLPQQKIQIQRQRRQQQNSLSQRTRKIIDVKRPQNLQSNGQLQRGQLLSACLHSLSNQKQKQRILKVKEKKLNLQEYRQKSKSLKNITSKCRNLAQEYQSHISNYRDTSKSTVKNLSTIILIAKFMIYTCQHTNDLSLNNRRSFKQKLLIKKFIKKIKLELHKLNSINENQAIRDLLGIHHFSICAARISNKTDNQKASKMIVTCLMDTRFGVSINKAFEFASLYRRKIRTIQRCWIRRFKAQISMLKFYVQNHSQQLIAKYDHFKKYYQTFRRQNVSYALSYQYLNDSSCKLNSLIETYKSKLAQIQEITKVNLEITSFNSRSLKKHQKQLLDVPNHPPYPVTRYFRDLNILKSMVRTWFQIQHRKYSKKFRQNIL